MQTLRFNAVRSNHDHLEVLLLAIELHELIDLGYLKPEPLVDTEARI